MIQRVFFDLGLTLAESDVPAAMWNTLLRWGGRFPHRAPARIPLGQ